MELTIEPKLKKRIPFLKVITGTVEHITVNRSTPELERFKQQIMDKVRREYNLKNLKDLPIIRAYRDFFWEVGIDPTKIRPASEALIRRILQGKALPTINTVVDSYNLASIRSHISIGTFDGDRVKGELLIRPAVEGETFLGIGMDKPVNLKGMEIVVEDAEKLVAIYPYRDSDATKVTLDTNKVIILMCGVPGVEKGALVDALNLTVEYLTLFCGGERSY